MMSSPSLSPARSTGWGLVVRLPLLSFLLAALFVGIWLLSVPYVLPGAVIGLLAIVGILLLRPPGFHILGPHFFYDLIRLARRGRSTLVRIAYALFLLFGLCLVYANRFNLDPLTVLFAPGPVLPANALAGFAESFMHAILFMQILAVFLLTPAYVGGAIAEERQAGTLDLLLTTHLTDREIVLGKLFARLVHMAGVLLVGLPILALTQFLGGVDMTLILAGFANTFMALLGVGSVSILVSTQAENVLGAVFGTYGLIFILALLCLPFSAMSQVLSNDEATAVFAVGHLLLAGICIPLAIFSVRLDKIPIRSWGPPPPARPRVSASPMTDDPAISRPPLTGHPILWKTMHPVIGSEMFFLLPFYILAFAGLAFSFALSAIEADNAIMRLWVAFCLGITCISVAFQTGASIIRERQNKTLESLLLLPMSSWEILGTIFLGNVLRMRYFFVALGLLFLIGIVVLAFHPFSLAWFGIAMVIHLAFFASMGLWVSTVSSNSLWAAFTVAVFLVVVLGGPWWFLAVLSPLPASWQSCMLEVGINPLGSWWFLMFSWQEWEFADAAFRQKLLTLPAGLATYASLAGAFWLMAGRKMMPK